MKPKSINERTLFRYLFELDKLDEEYGKNNWEFAGWHRKEFLHRLPSVYYVEVRHVPVIKNRTTHTLTSLPMPGVMLSHSPVTESLLASIYYEKASIFLYRRVTGKTATGGRGGLRELAIL